MKSMGNLIILIESYRRFCRPFVYATGCHVSSQGLLNGRHVAVSDCARRTLYPSTSRPAPRTTAAKSAAHMHSLEAHFPLLAIVPIFPTCGFSCSSGGRLGAEPHFGKMGRMGNRHLGHYFCILACFTLSKKLLSGERQKSKLSPAG